MPKQKNETQKMRAISNGRIKMLADRLSILMVICNARDEDEWIPWGLPKSYDDDDSMGDHIRRMKDYRIAKNIVRSWIEKADNATKKELGL